jgi:hypothetical protein
VPIDHEIGKGGAVRGVEQLRAGSQFQEHGDHRYKGAPIGRLSGLEVNRSVGACDSPQRMPEAMRAQRAPLRPAFSPARLWHVVYAGFSGSQMKNILA